MKASILISSKNRLHLFRRTLASIDRNRPRCDFEVVVADDGSDQGIFSELLNWRFPWKFISVDSNEFAAKTGYKMFWNCPAFTNNVAFKHSDGDVVFQMGNDIIAYGDVLNDLIKALPKAKYAWAVSTTYDVPEVILDVIGTFGGGLTQKHVDHCKQWKLSNDNNVPNYLSLFTRACWDAVGGYDERYVAGIGAEDSDFMRRVMSLPGFAMARSDSISLHQYHGGVNHFYRPLPSVITEERLAEGVAINRRLYHAWDGKITNGQTWEPGTIGVKEVITSADIT